MTTDASQPSRRQLIASLRHTALLLAIIVGLTLFGFYSRKTSPIIAPSDPQEGKVFLYVSIIALQYGLLRLIIVGLRRRGHSLSDIFGKKENSLRAIGLDFLIAGLFWIAGITVLEIIRKWIGGDEAHIGGLLPTGVLESAFWIILSITAGFVEEVCYRGYLQKQILALTGLVPVAIVGQAVLFGVSHSYQGLKSAIGITVYGGLFGLLAHWRKSLRPGIIAHAWTDIVGGLLK